MSAKPDRPSWIGLLALVVLAAASVWMLLRVAGRDPLQLRGVGDPAPSGSATRQASHATSDFLALSRTPSGPSPLLGAGPVDDSAGARPASVGSPVSWHGTVVDEHDEAIGGADVWLIPNGATLAAMGYHPTTDPPGQGWGGPVHVVDYAPLAELPHAVTDSTGTFAVAAGHIPYTWSEHARGGGTVKPMLAIAATGRTSRFVVLEEPSAPEQSLGSYALLPGASVSGRVVDADGAPLAGVRVVPSGQVIDAKSVGYERFLTALHTELFSSLTDDSGRYSLSGVWPGSLNLVCRRPGYLSAWPDRIDVGLAAQVEVPDVTLILGGELWGQVRDGAGNFVAGAELVGTGREITYSGESDVVTTIGEDADRVPLQQMIATRNRYPRTTSDADGRFHLGELDGLNLKLFVSAFGFEPRRVDDLTPGTRDIEVVLEPESTLLVEVVDARTGQPLTGAQAVAHRIAGEDLELVELSVEPSSDPTASLLVHGVGFVGTALDVWAPGHARAESTAPGVPARSQGRHVVRLEPEASISGTVRDASGEPVAGASAELQTVDRYRLTARATSTGSDGRFSFPNLDTGKWELLVNCRGRASARVRALETKRGAAIDDLEIVLAKGASIRGVIRDSSGHARALAEIRIVDEPFDAKRTALDAPDFKGWEMTDDTGRYEFIELPAGRYRVEPDNVAPIDVLLAEGEVATVDVALPQLPVVHGRVRTGGEAAVGLAVTAEVADGKQNVWIETVTTDDEGGYRLTLTRAGGFDVKVGADAGSIGYAPLGRAQRIDVGWGDEPVLDIELPGGRVSGRAIDQHTGEPRAGVDIGLSPMDAKSRGLSQRWTETDKDGRFRFVAVEADTYVIFTHSYMYASWQHVPYQSASIVLADGDRRDDLVLELHRGARISGTVSKANGKPVTDEAEVWVWRDGEDKAGSASPVKESAYALSGLAAGRYRVTAWEKGPDREGVPSGGAVVTLTDGEERRLDLIVQD